MTREAAPTMTLKLWDRSSIIESLETLVQDLATQSGASINRVVVTRGPDTFTASLRPNS